MDSRRTQNDLARVTLGVLSVLALLGTAIWIMLPFVSAILWATMVVITTWPLLEKLQSHLWGRRSLAAAVLTIALLLLLLIPMGIAAGALVSHMDTIVSWTRSLRDFSMPPIPAWVSSLPLLGPKLTEAWQTAATAGPEGLFARIQPYVRGLLEWIIGQLGSLGGIILQFLLTVAIAAILYMNGETAARGVRRFAYRLAGERCENAVLLAAGAIRGVALGVVVTAFAQTLVAGIGLAIASVPGTAVLISLILVLCLAQLGPLLIMLPVVIWAFSTGDTFKAGLVLVFALISGTMDNIMRPILIRRGADLPLLLIIAGVIGGMISFGFMGIFIGPVVLAVSYTLLGDWIDNRPVNEPPAS